MPIVSECIIWNLGCPISCFLCTISGIIAWRWLDFTSTSCYISSSLWVLERYPGTEEKKNHRYLSFYHLMSLGWLKSFQVGVLGVLVCVPFPRAGRAHGGLSFEPVGEKGKNVPPDQPDWFFSNVSLLCFRASVLLPYELDRNTK